MAFDSTLRCGGRTVFARDRAVVSWDGVVINASGSRRVHIDDRPVRFSWVVAARAEGDTARGTLQIAARRNGRACAGRAPRPFEARLGPAPAGASWRPPGGTALYGTGRHLLRGRLPAPVVLRVTATGRRVAARWSVAARCRRGPRERFTNLTPPTRIGAGAGFSRRERFAVIYTNAFVRYRVAFRGRFVGAGATGTLRLRATVLDRRGGRVLTRCDTRRRGWSAWRGGDPALAAPAPT